jgi:TIR domain
MFVFISHGDADRDFAAEIANSLRNAGVEAWLDASDVEPGTNWLRSGARALDRAEAMILVISAKTSGSPDLKKAFEFALTTPRFENRVITVERRAPSQVPFRYPWILRDLPFIKEAQDPKSAAEKILKFLKTAA